MRTDEFVMLDPVLFRSLLRTITACALTSTDTIVAMVRRKINLRILLYFIW